jgi:hypothetical protein
MNIERVIFVFNKNNDTLVKEVNADKLKIELVKTLFSEVAGDPNFYSPFKIEDKQYFEIAKEIDELLLYSYKEFDIYLEAVTV